MADQKPHGDQKYINALRNNDRGLITEIYRLFVPKVIGYVCQNSGDEAAAQDVVQESLITLYDQANTKGLVLTCPFDAYFFLICKRKWLNTLKKRRYHQVTIDEERLSISDDTNEEVAATEKLEQQRALYLAMLTKLGESCQKLIKLSCTKLSMKAIAQKLDISYAYARKKKSLCMRQLTDLISDHPQYQQF